jgi:hypothetical protein
MAFLNINQQDDGDRIVMTVTNDRHLPLDKKIKSDRTFKLKNDRGFKV